MPSRHHLTFLAALACTCLLSACATHHWKIVLKDGRKFQAISQPEFQTKTGYYRYQNEHGRDALLRADEVLLVEQVR